jgi:hypothetical protein
MSSLHFKFKKHENFPFQLEFFIFYIEFLNENENEIYVARVIVASPKNSTNIKSKCKTFPFKIRLEFHRCK